MAKDAAAVEHPHPAGGPADGVALGVFARFDGHCVVLGAKDRGKQGAVLAGVGVPAVAVPDALRAEGAVIGDDVPAVDHVDVPAGAVGQGQPGDADVPAVGQVHQPAPHPAGEGVLVFTAPDQVLHRGQLVLHPLLFPLDGGPGQGVASAPDGPLAPDADVLAVGAGGMVQRAEVEQAGTAFHLGALEAAANAGLVVLRPVGALQDGVLFQVQFHIAVAEQGSAPIDPRRKIDTVPCPAGVEGPLQGGGVVGAAVAHGPKGRRGDVEAALGRLGEGPHPAHGADLDLIGGIRRKAPQGKVGLSGAAPADAVHQDVVPRGGPGGQVPIDGDAVRPGQRIQVRHTNVPFSFWHFGPSIPWPGMPCFKLSKKSRPADMRGWTGHILGHHLPVLIRPSTRIKRNTAPASRAASQTGHSTHTQGHAIRPKAFSTIKIKVRVVTNPIAASSGHPVFVCMITDFGPGRKASPVRPAAPGLDQDGPACGDQGPAAQQGERMRPQQRMVRPLAEIVSQQIKAEQDIQSAMGQHRRPDVPALVGQPALEGPHTHGAEGQYCDPAQRIAGIVRAVVPAHDQKRGVPDAPDNAADHHSFPARHPSAQGRVQIASPAQLFSQRAADHAGQRRCQGSRRQQTHGQCRRRHSVQRKTQDCPQQPF